jgi:hypothetical protein
MAVLVSILTTPYSEYYLLGLYIHTAGQLLSKRANPEYLWFYHVAVAGVRVD